MLGRNIGFTGIMTSIVALVAMAAVSITGCGGPGASPVGSSGGLAKNAFVLRINCGGDDFTDARENVWKGDKAFTEGKWGYEGDGGSTVERDRNVKIANTDLQGVFRTERYGLTKFHITVPKKGDYTLALLFAETYSEISSAGQRVFKVSVNGKVVEAELDPVKLAGGPVKAFVKIVDVATDKDIVITFDKVGDQNPLINGIVVVEGKGPAAQKVALAGIGEQPKK